MTFAQIAQQASVPTLRDWLDTCEFWAWNAAAEGSARGVTLWENRARAIEKRIISIYAEGGFLK